MDELEEKLSAIHRIKQMTNLEGRAGSIDIDKVIEELINERLIIQEACMVELDEDPFFKAKVNNYTTNRSVIRLRQEEVQNKINVTEDEVYGYFKKYYEEEKHASDEMYEKVKNSIKKKLLKEKEKKRSNDYIAELKNKATVWIDTEFLYSRSLNQKKCDNNIIARVNDASIDDCDFIKEARRHLSKLRGNVLNKEKIKKVNSEVLDSLIIYELVEQEAFKRNYLNDPLFKNNIEEYKDKQLLNLFKQKIILPRSIPLEVELVEYYETHKDDFRKDYEVWFSEMVLQTLESAEVVLKELREGADFEFLASKKSVLAMRTGVNVWIPLRRLSSDIRMAITDLEIGGVSDIVEDSRKYKIIKLKGKRGGEHKKFSSVKDRIKQIFGKKKFDNWIKEYIDKLRNVSQININKKVVNGIKGTV
ncbi:MAG: peptidyl-prolyl cis-trans isomerase [Desulfobacteraceae bacterium]|nr:peptidyl-prolyl cis-trans isomerase [Desulfobacteraceae bacterium]MBC2718704.1 peptidyl-prolyl cis-trans isomerase [Desulfobacteraceae bacterium]